MRKCEKCGAVLDAGEHCSCGGNAVSIYRSRADKEKKPKSELAIITEQIVKRAYEEYLRG